MEVFPPRKRIVARELTEAELQAVQQPAPSPPSPTIPQSPQESSPASHVEIIEAGEKLNNSADDGPNFVLRSATEPSGTVITVETGPAPAGPATFSETVIDPTVFGSRQRKRAHVLIYRWTQVALLTSALISAGGVAAWATQRTLGGRLCSFGALILACLAFFLTRRVKLSHRLRGYAVACILIATLVLAANIGFHVGGGGGGGGGHAPHVEQRSAPAPHR